MTDERVPLLSQVKEPAFQTLELHSKLRNMDDNQWLPLSMFRDAHSSCIYICIGVDSYEIEFVRRVCVAPPGDGNHMAVTVLTGSLVNESGHGSALIVVNCGLEPPTLQVALNSESRGLRSWSLAIDHEVQTKLLTLFPELA